MDYEKKYREAQKWIESIYSELSHEQQMEAEAFFPELKESEDEEIRKGLIKAFGSIGKKEWGGVNVKNAIAWLEKQEGCEYIKKDWLEHIKQSWYKEGFIDGKYSDGTSKEWTKNDAATLKELIDFLENGTAKLQHDLTRYANWLKIQLTPIKKQGNPTDINPSEFDLRLNKLLKQFETLPKEELANSLSFYLNVVQNDGTYKPDEKQGEQKPADKVEPKFKVGDWIAYNHNTNLPPRKIIQIANEHYIFNNGSFEVKTLEADWHLWTIQDAKDGDVLEFGDHGRLVSGIVSYVNKTTGKVDVNCLLENNNFKVGNYYNLDTIKPHPATKEQRDILFQKMSEAGYEWSEETHELKKIEQNPYGQRKECFDCQFNYAGECKSSCQMKRDEQKPTDEEMKELLRTEYEKGRADTIAEMKTAWSEEDERRIKNILSVLGAQVCWDGATGKKGNPYQKEIDWLKSLRPQKQWKPTDEQIKALHDLNVTGGISYAGQGQKLINLYNELKNLREE